MPVARDPRSYIKRRPVPIPINKSCKVESRSAGCYKTCIESVHDWREDKYKRREQQLTSQGYNAAPNIPYKGIGEPFYLDEQQLILHALGQWDERDDLESSSSSDDDDFDLTTESLRRPTTSATSIVLRRSKRETNTLQREVQHGRNMIRNVRLGHGLFDLIRQEQHAKQEAENLQSQKRAEQMRTEWQPPKMDSSSDEETDHELGEDIELSRFMHGSGPESAGEEEFNQDNPDSLDVKGPVSFIREDTGTETALTTPRPTTGLSSSPRPTTGVSGKRKKAKAPRPYTPHHHNILDTKENVSKDALFRQLCALHWLLEAMAVHNRTGGDNSIQMTPITSSWKLAPKEEIGGAKVFPREMEGMTWNDLLNLKISQKIPNKRKSRLGTLRHAQGASKSKGLYPSYPHGLQSSNLRVSSSLDNSIDESQQVTSRTDAKDDEEEGRYQSIFKYLNEDFAAKLKEGYEAQERQDSAVAAHRERKKERRKTDSEHSPKKSPRKSADHAKSDLDRARSAGQRENSRSNRADSAVIRPKSSPLLMHFQNNRASLKFNNIVNEMNQKFQERKEDAAIQLQEQLEQLERQRMAVCQNKFMAINCQAKGSSFHRAVEEMRDRSNKMFSKPLTEQAKKKEQQEQKGNWLADLMQSIPDDMKNGMWYYKVILDKLRHKYGMIEGTGQQHSKRTFFKVLERLREWEICSPDICAAIEFCREKIVDVPVEDFEEWFSTQFPKVIRPQTAPAGKKDQKKEERYQSAYSERCKSGYSARSGVTSRSGIPSRTGITGPSFLTSKKVSTAATVSNPAAVVRPMTTTAARNGNSLIVRPLSMR